MDVNPDAVIELLADADEPLSSTEIMRGLGFDQRGKLVSMLQRLVSDETLEKKRGGKYALRDPGDYDFQSSLVGTRRELLPTDKVAIAANARRKERDKQAARRNLKPSEAEKTHEELDRPQISKKTPENGSGKVSALPNGTIPVDKFDLHTVQSVDNPVTTLEEIEAKVAEEKARDQRIRDAVDRLKRRATFRAEPVKNLDFKIEILDGIGASDADLWDVLKEIIEDLRRLDDISVGPF